MNLFEYLLETAEANGCETPFCRVAEFTGEPEAGGRGSKPVKGKPGVVQGMGTGTGAQANLYYRRSVEYKLAGVPGVTPSQIKFAAGQKRMWRPTHVVLNAEAGTPLT